MPASSRRALSASSNDPEAEDLAASTKLIFYLLVYHHAKVTDAPGGDPS
jgi:hypothetical protein